MDEKKKHIAPAYATSGYCWSGGWDVERARKAVDQHDSGRFVESLAASGHVTRWSLVLGALGQRVAPALRLPRAVEGSTAGLDGVARQEAETLFVGSEMELSPAFPSLKETVRTLAMMGFAWWQTTYEPSADGTTIVPHTTLWPCDATIYEKSSKRWYAQTVGEGQIEILPDDPRWTLVGDGEQPFLDGAVRAILSDYVDAMFARMDQSDYSDNNGQPKPIGILPSGVKLDERDDEGKPTGEGAAAFESLQILKESDSGALFPHGMEVNQLESSPAVAAVFKQIIDMSGSGVAIALLGTDGTMKAGTGGVYSSPTFNGVAESKVAGDVWAIAKAANRILSIVRARNYGVSIKVAPRAVIRMPDTNRDAMTKSISERRTALIANVKAERDAGFQITQDRVNALATELDLTPPVLAAAAPGAASFAYDQDNGVITIGERRAELGKGPSDRDAMTIPQYRASLVPVPGTQTAEANQSESQSS